MVDAEMERRDHQRPPIERPCKLYVPRCAKYVSGSTWNLSRGGALLQVDRRTPIEPGDHLYLGIAMKRSHAVLAAGEMASVKVVRVAQAGGEGVAVAVRFVHETPELDLECLLAA